MKWTLIRTKVLAALAACLVVGVGGILALMYYSFARNSRALAAESVTGAQKLFAILETREISKMTAVSETLIMNPQVRDALAARDRSRLAELTAPLYPKLKKEGITNWMFHTPDPDMAVFLRLQNPAKFGDRLCGENPAAGLRFAERGDRLYRVGRRYRPVHSRHETPDRRRLRTSAQQKICGPAVLGRFERGLAAPR
ncbi:MAG TPA: hypothetical protein VN810_07480 [Terriglobales bacterium]|nr:hypothetical protein [Terriglobales bacterium]